MTANELERDMHDYLTACASLNIKASSGGLYHIDTTTPVTSGQFVYPPIERNEKSWPDFMLDIHFPSELLRLVNEGHLDREEIRAAILDRLPDEVLYAILEQEEACAGPETPVDDEDDLLPRTLRPMEEQFPPMDDASYDRLVANFCDFGKRAFGINVDEESATEELTTCVSDTSDPISMTPDIDYIMDEVDATTTSSSDDVLYKRFYNRCHAKLDLTDEPDIGFYQASDPKWEFDDLDNLTDIETMDFDDFPIF